MYTRDGEASLICRYTSDIAVSMQKIRDGQGAVLSRSHDFDEQGAVTIYTGDHYYIWGCGRMHSNRCVRGGSLHGGMPAYVVNLDDDAPVIETEVRVQDRTYCLLCRQWKGYAHDLGQVHLDNLHRLEAHEEQLRQRILALRRYELLPQLEQEVIQANRTYVRVQQTHYCLCCHVYADI